MRSLIASPPDAFCILSCVEVRYLPQAGGAQTGGTPNFLTMTAHVPVISMKMRHVSAL
jgi:hypothetical protein